MGIGLLASLIAGLIAGIGARIIMRIVALTAHMPPGFSIAGTLNYELPRVMPLVAMLIAYQKRKELDSITPSSS